MNLEIHVNVMIFALIIIIAVMIMKNYVRVKILEVLIVGVELVEMIQLMLI